jgi:hypothetical protein
MEVSDQLANLGAVIAGGIERNVQQNQFQAALPGMQEAFKSAMADFDSGRSGAGFSKIMAVAMQNPNNPYIQNVTQMAFKAGQFASDDYFKGQQINVSRAKAGGRQLTQEEVDAFNEFGTDGTGDTLTDYTTTSVTPSQPAARGLPATQPRIVPDGVAIVPDVNAQEGLPTRTGNEPPQVDLTTSVDLTKPVAETEGIMVGPQEVDDTYQLKPDEQKFDASFLQEFGVPVDSVIGKREIKDVEIEVKRKMELGGKQSKEETKKEVLKFKSESDKFKTDIDKLQVAARKMKASKDLKAITKLSGNDVINNVDLDTEGEGNDRLYKAIVTSNGTTTEVELSSDEYDAINTIKTAGETADVKYIPMKRKAEDKAKPQPGLPAVQPPPVAPQIPEEAAQLQQIVEQGKASKAGERAKSTANEIAKIDTEIKQLSAPSRQSGSTSMRGMYPSSGATSKSEKQKSPEQAQADIQRIMQLKARKDELQGKTTEQKIGEGSIVEQNGKRYKFTNGKPVLIN